MKASGTKWVVDDDGDDDVAFGAGDTSGEGGKGCEVDGRRSKVGHHQDAPKQPGMRACAARASRDSGSKRHGRAQSKGRGGETQRARQRATRGTRR